MNTHPFPYKIIYSNRKTLAIHITPAKEVQVRAPRGTDVSFIDQFLSQKESWVLHHLQHMPSVTSPAPLAEKDKRRYRNIARKIITQKVSYYANIMGVSYGRISIREQKTRWGSCSSSGNLNFNWRLILAPEHVLDYVVVHELAHRRQMNHSKQFYAVVSSVLPDYKISRKWLRDHGTRLWQTP